MSSEFGWLGTINLAREYISFAHKSQSCGAASDPPSEPVVFLYHHAIELVLKGYLQAKGTTEQELRKLGHDIRNCVEEFERRGGSLTQDQIDFLNMIPLCCGQVATRYFRNGWARRFRGKDLRNNARIVFVSVSEQAFEAADYKVPDWLTDEHRRLVGARDGLGKP